jgi:hypothetical protein
LRDSNMSILQTRVDRKMDIGIDQCDFKRCSPLIYCLQVRDVHHAKCLLGNLILVRRTFAVEYGPGLEFVLPGRKIDSLRLLFRGASNHVNLPSPGIRSLLRNSGSPSTPSRMRTCRWRLFCSVCGHGPAPSLSEGTSGTGQVCCMTAL